jgi:hypothetical protein
MIKFEEFVEKYNPIKNPLDDNASYDGLMFETFGAEHDFVCAVDNKKVWTIIDGESETSWLVAGYHFVNRFGYIITEVEWETGDEEVAMDDYITIEQAQEIGISFIESNISVHNFVGDELRSFIESKLTDEEKESKEINAMVAKYHVIDYIEDELGIEREEFEDNIHDAWLDLI